MGNFLWPGASKFQIRLCLQSVDYKSNSTFILTKCFKYLINFFMLRLFKLVQGWTYYKILITIYRVGILDST